MPIEPEVEKILDEHKDILEKHTEQIQHLQIDSAETKLRLKNIEDTNQEIKSDIKEIKSVLYQSQNSNSNNTALLGQVLLKMTDANTQITTNQDNNKTNLWIKVGGGIITVLGSILTGANWDKIKGFFN